MCCSSWLGWENPSTEDTSLARGSVETIYHRLVSLHCSNCSPFLALSDNLLKWRAIAKSIQVEYWSPQRAKYTNVHTLSVMDVLGEINIATFDVTSHIDLSGHWLADWPPDYHEAARTLPKFSSTSHSLKKKTLSEPTNQNAYKQKMYYYLPVWINPISNNGRTFHVANRLHRY